MWWLNNNPNLMITATEAKQLSGPTIEEMCEFFDQPIREAAKKGARKICIFHGLLENEAYCNTAKWKEFQQAMKELGFATSLHYEERQFVDMRINVSWE